MPLMRSRRMSTIRSAEDNVAKKTIYDLMNSISDATLGGNVPQLKCLFYPLKDNHDT
jgi:hypothetical protein